MNQAGVLIIVLLTVRVARVEVDRLFKGSCSVSSLREVNRSPVHCPALNRPLCPTLINATNQSKNSNVRISSQNFSLI